MNSFYEHHKDSIQFQYACFDRILLKCDDSTAAGAHSCARFF